jgi:uncharacterized membrane protein YoaK (UPF0700 family)
LRNPRALSGRQKTAVALCATWVAGFVDATGYILLSHIYTSNMTGNTIELTLRAGGGKWGETLQRSWPILMFVAGLLLSAIITEAALRRGILSFSSLSLALQAALIGTFVGLAIPVFNNGQIHARSFWSFNGLVALLAISMGLQNQTISRVGALSFRTTHVTGTLTKMGADLSEYLFWVYDQLHRQPVKAAVAALRTSPKRRDFRSFLTNFGLFLFFTIGAACSIVALRIWGILALLAPVCVLIVLVTVDLVSPIAASEEQKEIQTSEL